MSKRAVAVLVALAAVPALLPGAVLELVVDAPIHPVTEEYVVRGLARAQAEGARLVVIVLDTPGGLDSSMRKIVASILASRVPVAAYVAPGGARAASAGFVIALACDVFAMAPGTNTGAAHPVGISLTGQAMDRTSEEKAVNDAAAYVKSLAAKRGRSVALAEDAVRKSSSWTEQEAVDGKLADLVAASVPDLLARLDGRRVRRFDGSEAALDLAGQARVPVPMTSRQRFLLTISNPNLAFLLLMIGLLGLYFEFAHPGAILPGVLGGIALLLAIFSFQILPINYVGLLLILLAIGLFVLEVKVQSYGVLTAGGVAAMIIGSLMLVNSPIPELRPSLKVIVPVAAGVALIMAFLVTLVVRAHARPSVTGREGMIGAVGIARTDLSPAGIVFVRGEIWRAEADGPVARGERVRIVRVDDLTLRVTRA